MFILKTKINDTPRRRILDLPSFLDLKKIPGPLDPIRGVICIRI